jgi:hypothetical protein
MIALQYLKSFTHQSFVSQEEIPMLELEGNGDM